MPLKKSGPSIASNWQPCELTWYDPALGGTNSGSGAADPTAPTASGEAYNPTANTCAAPSQYPFGTYIMFTYGSRRVTCKVNDRGGAITGTHFDLSRGAAETLGMIHAGRVSGKFVVVSGAGNPAPSTAVTSNSSNASNSGGGTSIVDLLTGDVTTIGSTLAMIMLGVMKDVVIGIGDYIVVPFWHWNQRAVDYYIKNVLSGDGAAASMVATSVFWGFGYVLLWTDPNSGSLKPAAVRNSRIGKHVRRGQALPARRELIKPRDVKERTPVKPKPRLSSVNVAVTGMMHTDRPKPVKVTGTHVNGGNDTPQAKRDGSVEGERNQDRGQGETQAAGTKPDARNRARGRSLHGGGTPPTGTQGANGGERR